MIRIAAVVLSIAVIGFAVCAHMYISSHRWERRATFVRPDGHYQLIVMRQRPLLSAMPGQAGDAPGEILIEDRSGVVLHRKMISMVQTIEAVEWGARTVSVKLQGEWPLPD